MPVRSLISSVFRWPDAKTVAQAVRIWAEKVIRSHPEVVQIGYFGSYARGDWGVGSDLDLVIILESSDRPFELRAVEWDTLELPVPVDVMVYTREEWRALCRERTFFKHLYKEAVWLFSDVNKI